MALIVLASAQGSPGVSTTALGLALAWPRPCLLLDADPTGASAIPAGYFRGSKEAAEAATLIDLAISHRSDRLEKDLPAAAMQIPGTTVSFIPGASSHTQAPSLAALWQPLTYALTRLEVTGQDVIVDAGRLGLVGSPQPLIEAADLMLLTLRSHLPALAGARSWAQSLREDFERRATEARLGALLIGPGEPYQGREITKVLHIPIVADVVFDPAAAAVLSLGTSPRRRRWTSAPLTRSLNAATSKIRAALETAAPKAGSLNSARSTP